MLAGGRGSVVAPETLDLPSGYAPPDPAQAGCLVLSNMAAFRVPDGDLRKGSGTSDPYLKFTLRADGPEYDGAGPFGGFGGPTAATSPVPNAADPVWEG